MTTNDPAPRPGDSQGLVQALTDLFRTLAWNRAVPTALPPRQRRAYAFTGCLPWFLVNLRPDSLQSTFAVFGAEAGLGGTPGLIAVLVLAQFALAGWFAWLIGYVERRCSPVRFFLEGLVLPGIAASLLQTQILLKLFGLEAQS